MWWQAHRGKPCTRHSQSSATLRSAVTASKWAWITLDEQEINMFIYCPFEGWDCWQSLPSPRYSGKHFTTVWDWFKVLYFQNWRADIVLVFLFNFWLRKTIYWVFSVVMILHTCWGHCVCFHTETIQCSLNLNNTNNANIIIWHILKLILVVIYASYQFKNLIFFTIS